MPELLRTSIGFDPGLRHGALVRVISQFQIQDNTITSHRLLDFWTFHQWGPKTLQREGIGERTSIGDVIRFSQDILKHIPPGSEGAHVAIDWDPYSVYWHARRLQSVQLAFFIGYMVRGFQGLGFPVFVFPPSRVRARLGLPNDATKDQTWGKIRERMVLPEGFTVQDDVSDAVVLAALIAERVLRKQLNGEETPDGDIVETRLPSESAPATRTKGHREVGAARSTRRRRRKARDAGDGS